MNADTKNIILSLALGAQQLDLERSRMLLEDQRSQVIEKTAQVIEEVSFLQIHLYQERNRSDDDRMLFECACDALNILDPAHPSDRDE